MVKRYGIKVVLSRCDGTYEMLWDVGVPHYTTPSVARNARGGVVEHRDCEVSLYGSSCQISESLANRIRILEDEKKKMSATQWEIFKAKRVKSYNDEYYFKMGKVKGAES